MRDVHSHILFGVDDGARDLNESIAMLEAARQAGVTDLVATPHCRGSHFDLQKIRRHFEQLEPYAYGLRLRLGFEVHYRKLMEMGLDAISGYTTQGTNEFLFELPTASFPLDLERTIFGLRGRGLEVIIAHPERYAPVQEDISVAGRLVDMGCRLQLSANCFAEGRFSRRRRCALRLLEKGLVSFVASDAHCVDDYKVFARAPHRELASWL